MRIELHKLWYYRGAKFLMPGIYRVPQDISFDLAGRAINEGVAERIADPAPSRRKFRKGPAPENKAIDHGDDDD